MNKLVGYFDILGIKNMIKEQGADFDDSILRDFGAAATMVVLDSSDVTLDAFSDSVLISAKLSNYKQFVKTVRQMYAQWISDYILVRGGISIGDFDKSINPASYFARGSSRITTSLVYGEALVEAVRLERTNIPGALCFMNEITQDYFINKMPSVVLGEMFIWCYKKDIKYLKASFELYLSREKNEDRKRHLLGTLDFLNKIKKQKIVNGIST